MQEVETAKLGIFLDGPVTLTSDRIRLVYKGLSIWLAIEPHVGDVSGLRAIFLSRSRDMFKCRLSLAFGDNLPDGIKVPVLARELLRCTALLSDFLDASAVGVSGSDLICDAVYFHEVVSEYLAGGAFPALALVAFDKVDDRPSFVTRGLRRFTGQEVSIVGPGLDDSALMRRLVRLVHDMANYGAFQAPVTVPDFEENAEIQIEQVDDGTMVRAMVRFGPR